MRKAFTLLELLVVVGIMGMLGVAASGGYTALVRGMSNRGAVSAVETLLRAAKERAHVDRVPTAVFCYNRLLREATDDENAVAVGVMTAIRRSGRITLVKSKFLYDEFGDLDATYGSTDDTGELDNETDRRLYKFSGKLTGEMEYSVVANKAYLPDPDNSGDQELVALFSGSASGPETNLLMSAFYVKQPGNASWEIGDGYAFEFAEVQLPEGFVFGSDGKIPSEVGRTVHVETFYFDPDGQNDDGNASVKIISTRPDGGGMPRKFEDAGEATARSNEAEG